VESLDILENDSIGNRSPNFGKNSIIFVESLDIFLNMILLEIEVPI
jgi:hypothetical protein